MPSLKSRILVTAVIVVCALAALSGVVWGHPAAAVVQSCPAGMNCLPNPAIITDHATGMGAPLVIEDNEGKPPGQNAVMFWVDGFQAGSVNPVCAVTTAPYTRVACLGGPPFNATGGRAVLSLYRVVAGRVTGVASLDFNQLAWLDRWLAARGVR